MEFMSLRVIRYEGSSRHNGGFGGSGPSREIEIPRGHLWNMARLPGTSIAIVKIGEASKGLDTNNLLEITN